MFRLNEFLISYIWYNSALEGPIHMPMWKNLKTGRAHGRHMALLCALHGGAEVGS